MATIAKDLFPHLVKNLQDIVVSPPVQDSIQKRYSAPYNQGGGPNDADKVRERQRQYREQHSQKQAPKITTREYQQNFIDTFAPELNKAEKSSSTRGRGRQNPKEKGGRPVSPRPKPRYSDPDFEPKEKNVGGTPPAPKKGLKSYPVSGEANTPLDHFKHSLPPISKPPFLGNVKRQEETAGEKLERVKREQLLKKKKLALEELIKMGYEISPQQISMRVPDDNNRRIRSPFFINRVGF